MSRIVALLVSSAVPLSVVALGCTRKDEPAVDNVVAAAPADPAPAGDGEARPKKAPIAEQKQPPPPDGKLLEAAGIEEDDPFRAQGGWAKRIASGDKWAKRVAGALQKAAPKFKGDKKYVGTFKFRLSACKDGTARVMPRGGTLGLEEQNEVHAKLELVRLPELPAQLEQSIRGDCGEIANTFMWYEGGIRDDPKQPWAQKYRGAKSGKKSKPGKKAKPDNKSKSDKKSKSTDSKAH